LPHVSGYKDNASGRDKKIHPRKKGLHPEKTHFLPIWQQQTHAHEKTSRREKLFTTDLFHSRRHPFSLPRRAASRKRIKGHRKKTADTKFFSLPQKKAPEAPGKFPTPPALYASSINL